MRAVPGGDIETLNQYGWVVRADGRGQHRLPRFDEGSVDQRVWVPAKPAMLAAAADGSGHIYLLRSEAAASTTCNCLDGTTNPSPPATVRRSLSTASVQSPTPEQPNTPPSTSQPSAADPCTN
jgi:hypothetical protein